MANEVTQSADVLKAEKGINKEVVNQISDIKNEPGWMREFRLKSLEEFESSPMPKWGNTLAPDFQDSFNKRGSSEAEQKLLAGGKAQSESEVAYGSLQEDLKNQGVIFTDTDTALSEHPELLREYFGSIIPPSHNKFAALNSVLWSGGAFLYVPKGVHIEFPLQAYFGTNGEGMGGESMGQFERTLIIVDEGASVQYVEGCTATMQATNSLHSPVAEVVVKRNARCRYTTIQNWANNVDNLVTKRAHVDGDGTMQWFDVSLGSKLTVKSPAIEMREPGAHGEVLSLAFIAAGQEHDVGAELVHCAPNTTSQIVSKSISKNGGRGRYRGCVRVEPVAYNSRSSLQCDALILDDQSCNAMQPHLVVLEPNAQIEQDVNVSHIDDEQLFYMRSRGLTETQASTMIVNGFIESLVGELPMEYAVEMKRLIEMEIETHPL